MAHEIKKINPTQCTFTYLLGELDCYELRKGTCSLYLSEEEAQRIEKEEEGYHFRESSVMNCRDLARNLLAANYYDNSGFQDNIYSIRMSHMDCGHYVFTDGQHRTCIAKHLNIQSMYVNVENDPRDYVSYCRACYQKKEERREDEKLKNRLLSMLNLRRKKTKRIPEDDFIDEEYMNFKKTSTFIKN